MNKVKVSDFSLELIKAMAEILNEDMGQQQCLIKREKDNIVLVKIARHKELKTPIK